MPSVRAESRNEMSPRSASPNSPIPRSGPYFRTTVLSTLLNPHKLPRLMPNPNLPRACDLLFWVSQHFLPLRQPAYGARNREQHGKHLRLEAHRLGHDAGVEVNIRVGLALHEIILFERDPLQFERNFNFGITS